MPLRELAVTSYEARAVLLPFDDKVEEAICITVFGPNFPQRAVEPEILVGHARAERVSISRDQKSIRGCFRNAPPEGARIVVQYANSQEGVLREPFSRRRIRPLPKEC
jgi:hypothetical protein